MIASRHCRFALRWVADFIWSRQEPGGRGKTVAAIAGLMLVATASASQTGPQQLEQVKMAVFADNKRIGTATLSEHITQTGGKVVNLGMALGPDGQQVIVRSETTYDAKGSPTRVFQETTSEGKEHYRREVIVSFDDDGANVVLELNGDRSTTHVAIDKGDSRQDESEFWFIRDHPNVGDSVSAYKFNPNTLKWDFVKTTFHGSRPMVISGHKVEAYVTDSEQGTAFLDGDGLPLRLELPNAAMERIWEKL